MIVRAAEIRADGLLVSLTPSSSARTASEPAAKIRAFWRLRISSRALSNSSAKADAGLFLHLGLLGSLLIGSPDQEHLNRLLLPDRHLLPSFRASALIRVLRHSLRHLRLGRVLSRQ